jgi:hypothetical protein
VIVLFLVACAAQSPAILAEVDDLLANRPKWYLRAGTDRLVGGDLPSAIRAYKWGVREHPGESLLHDGLAIARSQVTYPVDPAAADLLRPESEWWPWWCYRGVTVVGGYLAFSLFCAAVTRWFMVRRLPWLVVAAVTLPVATVPAANEIVRCHRAGRDTVAAPAIVRGETDLREGNGRDYPAKLRVPSGVECRILAERPGWAQVEFASGLVGWVPQRAFQTNAP